MTLNDLIWLIINLPHETLSMKIYMPNDAYTKLYPVTNLGIDTDNGVAVIQRDKHAPTIEIPDNEPESED